jgi:hypothetical protein
MQTGRTGGRNADRVARGPGPSPSLRPRRPRREFYPPLRPGAPPCCGASSLTASAPPPAALRETGPAPGLAISPRVTVQAPARRRCPLGPSKSRGSAWPYADWREAFPCSDFASGGHGSLPSNHRRAAAWSRGQCRRAGAATKVVIGKRVLRSKSWLLRTDFDDEFPGAAMPCETINYPRASSPSFSIRLDTACANSPMNSSSLPGSIVRLTPAQTSSSRSKE